LSDFLFLSFLIATADDVYHLVDFGGESVDESILGGEHRSEEAGGSLGEAGPEIAFALPQRRSTGAPR
jgi:hypothetical protein